MKAISLWQPWATLVVTGAKRFETRSWPTPYRGPLLIHAAKKRNGNLDQLQHCDPFAAALHDHLPLPYGCIVGVVQLVDCWGVERLRRADANRSKELDEQIAKTLKFAGHKDAVINDALRPMLSGVELAFGDYSPGRFAWVLDRAEAFETPIPFAGAQGFFTVPDELATAAIRVSKGGIE